MNEKDKNNDEKQIDGTGAPVDHAVSSGVDSPPKTQKPAFSASMEHSLSDRNALPDDPEHGEHNAFHLDLSRDRWNTEYKHNSGKMIQDTPQGRLAIRALSRGVLGAVFYTAAGHYATDVMREFRPNAKHEHWLHQVAGMIDKYAGKPIETLVNMAGHDGAKAVTFRPTRLFYKGTTNGRTLGHEVISTTFDFAAMSIGDAIGRDLAVLVDPNAKHRWQREDGSVDLPKTVTMLTNNVFQYLTYNAGEDLAVALPYVYLMRGQRNLLEHVSPGFRHDADASRNGGSFKVDDNGHIVGNYALEGLADLQGRFTAYNVGTLMYREAYLNAAEKIRDWGHHNYALPKLKDVIPSNPLKAAANGIGDLTRWAVRDAVKGTIYMTPSVPLFWMTRTPQSKYKGIFIHPEKGAMGFNSKLAPHRRVDLVHANEYKRTSNRPENRQLPFTHETPVFFSEFNDRTGKYEELPAKNPIGKNEFKPYSYTYGAFDAALNKTGEVSNELRRALHVPGEQVERWWSPGKLGDKGKWKRLTDTYITAAVSYTPYFWAKTEFAHLWDNARMDMAIERAIDGVSSLNFSEINKGVGEVTNTIMLKPLSDPEREKEAKYRIKTDISPADVFDPEIFRHYERPDDTYDPTRAFSYERSPLHGHNQPTTMVSPSGPPVPQAKASFVERLDRHKKDAASRLDEFKQREGSSFSESVKQENPADLPEPTVKTAETKEEKKATFVDQVTRPASAEKDFPSSGTTFH